MTRRNQTGGLTGAGGRQKGRRTIAALRLLAESRPHVSLVVRLPQEFRGEQNLEQFVTRLAVEVPEPLDLAPRQMKPGDFTELAPDDLQPIRYRGLNW
jgi:hypothetical protein